MISLDERKFWESIEQIEFMDLEWIPAALRARIIENAWPFGVCEIAAACTGPANLDVDLYADDEADEMDRDATALRNMAALFIARADAIDARRRAVAP